MHPILETVRNELKANADEHTKSTGQHFFRETVHLYGVKTAIVTRIAKAFDTEITSMGKREVFALCEDLWKSGIMEESFVACHWSYRIRKTFTPEDIGVFGTWIERYVSNWASCDTLCNHTVGSFVEMYPEHLATLKTWATSKNRWMKRAAAVSLIIPARHGKFLGDVFAIADILLSDGDDMVQKGYGWMLKAASETHQNEVFEYVVHHKKDMPRTALRYAIEKMPPELKARAMAK